MNALIKAHQTPMAEIFTEPDSLLTGYVPEEHLHPSIFNRSLRLFIPLSVHLCRRPIQFFTNREKNMQKKLIAALIAAAFPFSTDVVSADDKVLPEVTVTVDRLQMERDESSSNVQILERPDFEALPVQDTFDALALMPNVDVRRAGSVFGEGSITMYGISGQPFAPTSNVIAVNGVPLNNGLLPETSLNMLPLKLIERFEMIQGPGSSAYGSNATTGVLNLVTRRPQRQLEGGVDATVASRWDTHDGSAYAGGGQGNDYSWVVGGSLSETDGNLQPSGRKDFSDSRKKSVAFFGDKTFNTTRISTGFIYYDDDEHNPDVRTPNRSQLTEGQRTHFNAGISHSFTDQVSIEATYMYNYFDGTTQETFDTRVFGFGPNALRPSGPTDQTTESNGVVARVNWNTEHNLLTLGLEAQNAEITDNLSRVSNSGNTRGVFVQDRFLAFDDQLSLNFGYRYDKASIYSDASNSPKFGFVWKPKGSIWLVRGNVSKAFNAPTFNQLFSTGFVRGNPNLVAQTLLLKEVDTELRPMPALNLGLSIFHVTLDNPIFPRFNSAINATQFTNVSPGSKDKGATLTAEYHPGAWLVGASYTYLDPGTATFHTWENTAKFYAYYKASRWSVGGDVRHQSNGYWADNFANPANDYTVVDLRAAYMLARQLKLLVGAENLTDEDYATTASIGNVAGVPNNTGVPRPGRYFTVGLEASF